MNITKQNITANLLICLPLKAECHYNKFPSKNQIHNRRKSLRGSAPIMLE